MALSARTGEVVDETRHLVVEHQRQVGLGGFDFGFGLGLDVGIDGKCDVVGFIDGRRLRAGLGKAVALFQRAQLQLVNGLDQFVELPLQPLVISQVEVAGQQGVERPVEVSLGSFQMTSLVIGLSSCVFLLRLGDQRLSRVGFGNGDIRSTGRRLGCWSGGLGYGGSDSVGRQKGRLLGLRRPASHSQQAGCEGDQEHGANKSHQLRKSPLQLSVGQPLRCYYAVNFRVNETG